MFHMFQGCCGGSTFSSFSFCLGHVQNIISLSHLTKLQRQSSNGCGVTALLKCPLSSTVCMYNLGSCQAISGLKHPQPRSPLIYTPSYNPYYSTVHQSHTLTPATAHFFSQTARANTLILQPWTFLIGSARNYTKASSNLSDAPPTFTASNSLLANRNSALKRAGLAVFPIRN